MNKFIKLLLCSILLSGTAMADIPKVGDALDTVLRKLGKPSGNLTVGDVRYLYFDRGSVVLKDNRVIELDVKTDEEWAAHLEEQEALRVKAEKEREEMLAQFEAERGARIEEGLKVREKMRNSLEFQASTPEHQVKLWRLFMKKYPEVNVTKDYLPILAVYEKELKHKQEVEAQKRRLADLERRVRDAEARAKKAEEVAREENSRTRRVRYYPYSYYPYYPSVIINRPRTTPEACKPGPTPYKSPGVVVSGTISTRNNLSRSGSNSLGTAGTRVHYAPYDKSKK